MRKLVTYIPAIVGVIGTLMGASLAIGGGWLVTLGGSPFFLLAGAAMVVAGILLCRRNLMATWVSLGLLAAALCWNVYEVGFDFWPSFSRLMVFLGIALVSVLLAPQLKGRGQALVSRTNVMVASLGLGGIMIAMIGGMFVIHPTISPTGTPEEIGLASTQPNQDWRQWGNGTQGTHYASIGQITPDNVKNLKVAWTYHTGDIAFDSAEFQGTPIKVGDTLFVCTPFSKVAAVDASTGQQRWTFDPKAHTETWQRCRGIGYAETPTANSSDACQTRIVLTTIDARLITLDASTGKVCPAFGGEHGSVNLLEGMGPTAKGSYYPTSAPLVAGDIVVVGGKINDNLKTGEPSGVVRGFNVRTGALAWAWDPANPNNKGAPPPGGMYQPETPNFWGTASFDAKLGLIYIPTGNQTPDFWGGNRHPASDEFNDSIVALDVKTGNVRWSFRTVNHDLYDYDVAAQPILYDMPDGKGGSTPVVVGLTKRGQVFVLDRRNGKPVVPVTYRKVPQNGAPKGQYLAPTQPYSAISVGTDRLLESDMWGGTIFDQLLCRIEFKRMRYEGEFTPVGFDRTLIYPGYYGGFNWGGGAIDERTGTLYVNDIRMAQWARFVDREWAKKSNLKPTSEGEYSEQVGTPYGVERSMFFSPIGTPCFKPPYGSMTAIDLKSGKIKWQVPAGTIADAPGMATGIPVQLGMPTMGGPLVTGGGLTFFSGTLDLYLRAFDNRNGKEVWKARLPVGSQAAPISYTDKNGKQFIVVTAGGLTRTGNKSGRGDYVIAYALP